MTAAVHLERRGRLATLTLDRPPVNVLDLAALAALNQALAAASTRDDLQLLVVRGAGGRALSAGVAVEDHTPDKMEEMLGRFHAALGELERQSALTLAVVEGHCLGGGFELALACDFVLAAEGSRFGQPEIRLGCFPPYAAAALPRRVGPGRALEIMATGRAMDAAEASRLGLVTWIAPRERLEGRLEEIAAELTGASAAVTRLLKQAVLAGRDLPLGAAVAAAERIYLGQLPRTRDLAEGLDAFREKRAPRWEHR